MKSSNVFLVLMVAASACTPAWGQDEGGLRGDSGGSSVPGSGFTATLRDGLHGLVQPLFQPEPDPRTANGLGAPSQMSESEQGSAYGFDWEQGDYGALQDDPYHSNSSAGTLGNSNPFALQSLTKRSDAKSRRFGERHDLNPYATHDLNPYSTHDLSPYATGAPRGSGDEDDTGVEDEADLYGLANTDDSRPRSRRYGGSSEAYGHSFDAGRRTADLLKHYDRFGRYTDGLTTYPYDPCAVVTPYERGGESCAESAPSDSFGAYGDPHGNRSLENAGATGAPGNYGQYGYYAGTASIPFDPYRAPRGNRSLESPYMTAAPGSYRPNGYNGKAASNLYDPSGLPRPYPRSNESPNRAALAPSDAGAAGNSAGQSTPSPLGADATLKSSLDSLDRQLSQAEADLRAARVPGLPDQLGHNQGTAPPSERSPIRPNPKPRDGKPHPARAAAKQRTPDQYGVHNGESNSSNSLTIPDPLAQGVHPSSTGGLGD